ncbi:hypothetical protein K470DRAFT_193144, partial [Piedraia hortae CBS 480.64]
KQPAGGYDSTPIPPCPSGYTLKITIHGAEHLPMADISSFSSDPYVLAELNSATPTRHKEDPPLRFRTPTVRNSTDPQWNETWIVANVPSTGFRLKFRIYDEDHSNHDDRLGNVKIYVDSLSDSWPGIHKSRNEIKIRSGSKRAYAMRIMAACMHKAKHVRGFLIVSVDLLGRTGDDGQSGRMYTVGPCRWIRHYDPMLGRITNTVEDEADEPQPSGTSSKKKKKVKQYNFQANEIQLPGPVPAELYHRFVEFKPWVKRMFTSTGLEGLILSKALHHQHARVYNFDKQTVFGYFPDSDGRTSRELTRQFLELVHWDKGGKIFTYVLTLDALWRFTETGKEFGIDLLSKHTMHSDVAIYIAYSGEFFIRRRRRRGGSIPSEVPTEINAGPTPQAYNNTTSSTHTPAPIEDYELIIDNDSGTYRPNGSLLSILKTYLERSLPGLTVTTLDCNSQKEKMNKLKNEQREKKKHEGGEVVYLQRRPTSSVSSSDEEDLDRVERGRKKEEGGRFAVTQAVRDQGVKAKEKVGRWK